MSLRVLRLYTAAVLLVSACGRSELSGWLLTDTDTQSNATSTGPVTSGGGQANTTGSAIATATVVGETSAGGGVTAVTGSFGESVSSGGSLGGAFSEGGEGGEASGDLMLEPSELAPGRYKLHYAASFSVSGGSGSYEFRLIEGELPPGLSLASDGALSGIPSFPGTWSFVVEVTGALGARGEHEYLFEIERNSLMVAALRLGSAIERQDALLIDLDAPGDGLLHREEWSRNLEFSPDGRWLRWNAFTPDGDTSRYATPLVDRSTIELLALTGVATDGTRCSWSPDSTKIACTTPNTDDSNFRLSFRSSPELNFVVSSDGTNSFLHALEGTATQGPLDVSGAGDLFIPADTHAAFAPRSPRFAATADGRVIVSTLVAGVLDNAEISGAYTPPAGAGLTFSPDARWLAIPTEAELWLCDLAAPEPFLAVKLGELAQSMAWFAPDSSALAFVTANRPTTLTVVELGNPLEFSTRVIDGDYADRISSNSAWSNDNSYFLLYGQFRDASETEIRAMYAFDMLDPKSPARLIASCEGSGGSEPSCPGGGYFQPWVAWASANEP